MQAWTREAISENLKLTGLMLNGVCMAPASCEGPPVAPNGRTPVGVNYPGAVFKIVITALDTTLTSEIGCQLMRSNIEALEAPSVFLGLGQSTNYISFINAGMNNRANTPFQQHPSIIPNTDLLMIPYKRDQASMWVLQMLYTQSPYLVWVVLAGLVQKMDFDQFPCFFP